MRSVYKKTLLIFGVGLLLFSFNAQAVEKTAIDKRLNPGLDASLQAMQVFLDTLTGRLERDLAAEVTRLNQTRADYEDLMNRLEDRIEALRANYDVCDHAIYNVPTAGTYDVSTNRLRWLGNGWRAEPTQPWERPSTGGRN